MKELVDQLDALTAVHTLLIGLAVAALYYFLLFDDGAAISQNINRMSADVAQKQQIAIDTRQKLKEGEKFKVEAEKMKEQYQEALEFLPSEVDVSGVLTKVTQQVRSAGANIVRIEPQAKAIPKGMYEEFYMELELQGTFGELTQFIANLTKIKRVLNIKSFEMVNEASSAEVPILNFSGQLVGYRYVGETQSE